MIAMKVKTKVITKTKEDSVKATMLKTLGVSAIATVAVFAGAPAAAEKWDMPMAYSDSNFHTLNG